MDKPKVGKLKGINPDGREEIFANNKPFPVLQNLKKAFKEDPRYCRWKFIITYCQLTFATCNSFIYICNI